jgi:hypothetical protein
MRKLRRYSSEALALKLLLRWIAGCQTQDGWFPDVIAQVAFQVATGGPP